MSRIANSVDVQQPDPQYRVGEYNWHVWEDLGNNVQRWLGFFRDDKDALDWARSKPGNYCINNVPPESSNQRTRKVWNGDQPKAKRRPPQPKVKPQRTTKYPVMPAAAPVADSPELRKAKAKAKDVLDKHRADEVAEYGDQA